MKILLVVSRTNPELTKKLLLEWGFFVDIYDKDLYFSDDTLEKFREYVFKHNSDIIISLGEDADLFCSYFYGKTGWPWIGSMQEFIGKTFRGLV